jgi:hypothetical protein
MGEQDRGYHVERISRSYHCSNGHVATPQFAASVNPDEIPTEIDCPNCGLPAGTDQANPPQVAKVEPYKTHLAYVKERRTEAEAEQILAEALQAVRERRERALAAAKARR